MPGPLPRISKPISVAQAVLMLPFVSALLVIAVVADWANHARRALLRAIGR